MVWLITNNFPPENDPERYVAYMEAMKRIIYIILTGKPKGKRNFEELGIEGCGVDSFPWRNFQERR